MAKESPRPKPKQKKASNSAFQKFEQFVGQIVRVQKDKVRDAKNQRKSSSRNHALNFLNKHAGI